MSDPQPDPIKTFTGALRWNAIATGILYLALAAVVAYVFLSAARTHHALCTFRADLVERVQQGNAFLAKHPEGFAGISAAEIRVGLANQERTIDSLSGLHCRTKETP